MTRMICIGAQSIAVGERTPQMRGVEMPCRRDSGPHLQLTYFGSVASFSPKVALLQLSLFEDQSACPIPK